MSNTLSSLQIDASTFFSDNDIDLTCPECEGKGETAAWPEGVTVEQFTPTAEQCEEHGLDEGTDYWHVVGMEELEEEAYETEEEANEAVYEASDVVESCPECGGTGSLEIMWNTIWNTEFHSLPEMDLPNTIGPVVFFEYNDEVWMGLSGCGQDMSPYLCAAWIEAFPDCNWIPDNFARIDNMTNGWFKSKLGQEKTDKIMRLMVESLKMDVSRAQDGIDRLTKALEASTAQA